MKLVSQGTKYKNKCLHLGQSLYDKLVRSADYHRRSISQEACFLMELGMTAPIPPTMADTQIDDVDGRFQCYLDPPLMKKLNLLAKRMQPGLLKPKISPVARAYIRVGFAMQHKFFHSEDTGHLWPNDDYKKEIIGPEGAV